MGAAFARWFWPSGSSPSAPGRWLFPLSAERTCTKGQRRQARDPGRTREDSRARLYAPLPRHPASWATHRGPAPSIRPRLRGRSWSRPRQSMIKGSICREWPLGSPSSTLPRREPAESLDAARLSRMTRAEAGCEGIHARPGSGLPYLVLWAFKPGRSLASVGIPITEKSPLPPVRLVLDEPVKRTHHGCWA